MLTRSNKLLTLVTLCAGMLYASHILALGLGELTVNSSLNEPLDASVQLLGLDGLTVEQIEARLGTLEDFERADINRVGLIDLISMEVVVSNSQAGILRLTSTEPVIEPFLSMIISVRWPTGRLMRDYTALIDLPVFLSNTSEIIPVNIPQTPAPVPATEEIVEIVEIEEIEEIEELSVEPAVIVESPVQVSEPVSPLAEESTAIETDSDTGTEEISESPIEDVAGELEEEQPEAVAETIAELEESPAPEAIPEAVEELTIAADPASEQDSVETDAVVEETSTEPSNETVTIESGNTLYDIAAQNRPGTTVSIEQTMIAIQRENPSAFIDNNINMIRVGQVLRIPSIQAVQSIDQSEALNQINAQNQAVSVQPLAFNSNESSSNDQGADELTILSGEDGTDSLTGNSDMAETIAALENQLALSEENLDRARLENEELSARFSDLQDQVEILQNIIAMQDERMAQLQADLAARNEEAVATITEVSEEADEAVQAVAAQTQPVANSPADNSLLAQISSAFESTMVLVSSLLGLILLVVGFLVWRRRAAQDDMEDFGLSETGLATGSGSTGFEEPEGASAGFSAAAKAMHSDEPDDSETDQPEPALENEIDAVEESGDLEENIGFMGKMKQIFTRSSDDTLDNEIDSESDEEIQDSADDVSDLQQEDNADDDEDLDLSEDFIDELDDFDDELEDEEKAEATESESIVSAAEEEIDEIQDLDDVSSDSLADNFSDENEIATDDVEDSDAPAVSVEEDSDLSDTDADLDLSLDDEFEFSDPDESEDLAVASDLDEIDELDEITEIAEIDNDSGESEIDLGIDSEIDSEIELDDETLTEDTSISEDPVKDEFDLGDFSMDDIDAETSAEAEVEESDKREQSAEAISASEADPEDEIDTLEFGLDDALDSDLTSDSDEDEDEEIDDLESFDFSLDDTDTASAEDSLSADGAQQESVEEDSDIDLESFEFNVDDLSSSDDSDKESAQEKSEEADLETFDFDVSSVSTFEESDPEQADVAPEKQDASTDDLETFSFDDEISIDDLAEDEVEIELEAESEGEGEESSLDSLAAALEEVDESDVVTLDADDDLDLGEIEIDDSLFDLDADDELGSSDSDPITDRDESSTKLDLAVAYEAMGDMDGAKEILAEVMSEGSEEHISEAKKLLDKWGQS